MESAFTYNEALIMRVDQKTSILKKLFARNV